MLWLGILFCKGRQTYLDLPLSAVLAARARFPTVHHGLIIQGGKAFGGDLSEREETVAS